MPSLSEVPPNATPSLTWNKLILLEPRLLTLYDEAKNTEQKPGYTANAKWFGEGEYRSQAIKPRLLRLVGWTAEGDEDTLHSCQAYDIAYHTIYWALPDDWQDLDDWQD